MKLKKIIILLLSISIVMFSSLSTYAVDPEPVWPNDVIINSIDPEPVWPDGN